MSPIALLESIEKKTPLLLPERPVLRSSELLLVTAKFALDLGSGLRRGKPTVK